MSASGLRVGFDASWCSDRQTGIGRYAGELLAGLRRVAPQHRYLELRPTRPWAGRVGWTQAVVPVQLRRARVDVCHFTHYHAPLAWRGPMVLTLHDLTLLELPTLHPRRRVTAMAPLLRTTIGRAAAVIVPSRTTRDGALRLLGVPDERLHVIPEAPAAAFRRVTDEVALRAVQERYGLTRGFVLAVGTLEPRKNLVALVDAWATLRARGCEGVLVLVGDRGWQTRALDERLARGDAAAVRRLGYVPDADLPALLTLAGAFAYPSLGEGFGLPVIEALACGTPTVTSGLGATAEVAGDAALLVDPRDRGALADALEQALTPGATRDRLTAAGPRRAATYSWDAAATATARVYTLVAEGGRA
jgi:glycosyltransferase involved in cell wall biosynthesis